MNVYVIREIGGKNGTTEYEKIDDAKKFATTNIENYKNGFEIIHVGSGRVEYKDKREEVSRTDLIDWD